MALDQVAFDIETTGFAVSDEVTVAGFALPMGVRVFVQTGESGDGDADSDVAAAVRERCGEHVQLSTHASEQGLLRAVGAFTSERLADADVVLVAFNGEVWSGGFDLPFLRTRLARRDVTWPFAGVPYADLLPVVRRQFNTAVETEAGGVSDGDGGDDDEVESRDDLVGVYETLCDGQYAGLDPFADSAEAVTAFEDGHVVDLVLHNVADVLRTRAVGRVAERYCSKADFQVKSLTPTIDD